MKEKGFQGVRFRALRSVVRWLYPPRVSPDEEDIPKPCVFVCRHKNMSGPILSLCWLKTQAHPWVLHVFCHRASCYRQFRDYTLTVRMRWPKWFALCAARVISVCLPPLLRSVGGIEVFRESAQSMRTIRESMRCLLRGETIILFPDVDYISVSPEVGKLYEGFAMLGSMYEKKTGTPLSFVPLAVGRNALAFGPTLVAQMRDIGSDARQALVREIAHHLQMLENDLA